MRVAHITPVFPPYRGGMGAVAFHQARCLAEMGVEVTVFTPRAAKPPTAPDGVQVVALSPLLAKGNAALLPQILWRVGGYDVVHLHYPFFGAAELLALRRLGTGPPIVLQYQMDVLGTGWLARVFRWHRRMLLPLIIRAADVIVVTSRDYAASSFLAPKLAALDPRLAVIPAGVDLSHFSPEGERAEISNGVSGSRNPLVFFVGGLDRAHYFKGLHILLDAMVRLPGASLIVGGDGDLRSHYEAQARRFGLDDRVSFVGDIPDQALPAYYRTADVVVLPSIDRTEAFGLVLLEAMACGKPVVASRLPGVRTLVDDGRSGYLTEPGDPIELAEKIARCASQGAALGAQARRFVEEGFAWEQLGKELLGLYCRLVGQPPDCIP